MVVLLGLRIAIHWTWWPGRNFHLLKYSSSQPVSGSFEYCGILRTMLCTQHWAKTPKDTTSVQWISTKTLSCLIYRKRQITFCVSFRSNSLAREILVSSHSLIHKMRITLLISIWLCRLNELYIRDMKLWTCLYLLCSKSSSVYYPSQTQHHSPPVTTFCTTVPTLNAPMFGVADRV